MPEQGHTKLPWVLTHGREKTLWIGPPGDRMPVAELPETHGESYATVFMLQGEREANGEFIVRACNCHDELVEVCGKLANVAECVGHCVGAWVGDHAALAQRVAAEAREALSNAQPPAPATAEGDAAEEQPT